jgi:photosystem II stability/assembly factor-like uncharacterized protein
MRRSAHFPFAFVILTALFSISPAALANGRFPAADQLIVNPVDPQHIVARTTFGFVQSRDGGKTWLWSCEEIIGRIANQDPPFAVSADGSLVVAVPFEGVSVTHDGGCTWTRAPAPLAGQLAVDVTSEPNDAAALIVLTSTNDTSPDAGPNAPSEFLNLVVQTKDNGTTWALRGVPLARDFIAATIEIAPSDPNRIYASGVYGDPLRGAIERSSDGGRTWTRGLLPLSNDLGGVFISAVDPSNPDRLYVRVLGQPDQATGATATQLLVSSDQGSTWKQLVKTDESMLGFALSPDGASVAYGTIGQGVFLGPADGSTAFEKVSSIQNRCLTWSAAGLYACGTDLGRSTSGDGPETFAIGRSRDLGRSFESLYRLFQTCPITCPDESDFNKTCRLTWQMDRGLPSTIGATGQTCIVPWARTAPDGGAADAGSGGAAGATGDAGREPGSPSPPVDDSCACRTRGRDRRAFRFGAWGLGLVAMGLAARRHARRRAGK